MEQAPSAVNWRAAQRRQTARQMRLWQPGRRSPTARTRVLFFQWRQSRGGAEKFHSAMVPHGGPDTRICREVVALGRSWPAPETCAGTPGPAPTSRSCLTGRAGGRWSSRPARAATCVTSTPPAPTTAPLYDAGVACDVVHPDGRPLRLPARRGAEPLPVTAAAAARLEAYVEGGGTLVMSFFSGIVDGHDRVHLGGYPAPLRDCSACASRSSGRWPKTPTVTLSRGTGGVWSEEVDRRARRRWRRFADGDLAGRPAVTRHRLGAGVAWYLGTRPDPATMRTAARPARAEAGVAPVLPGLPEGVQACARDDHYLLLNHGTTPAEVHLPALMRDLLTGTAPADVVRLEPRGVALLRLGRPTP